MNPTNFSGLFSGGPTSALATAVAAAASASEQDVDMVTPRSQSPTAYLAFAATGASPSLGVPPLELNMGLSALWQQQQQQQQQQQGQAIPAVAAAREQRRKRHFSLEDCHHDESNDSNLSSLDNSGLVTLGAVPANEYEEEANHAMLMSFSKSENSALSLTKSALISPTSDGCPLYIEQRLELEEKLAHLLEADEAADNLKRRLNIPEGLLKIVSSHVMQEAEEEPYGLNGCVLHVYYEGHHDLHPLGSLTCDLNRAPTFEITLTLREGQAPSWGQRMARRLSLNSQSPPSSCLEVGTSYKLVKKRKHRQSQN